MVSDQIPLGGTGIEGVHRCATARPPPTALERAAVVDEAGYELIGS
jgi:hypothetical protein